MYLPSVIVNLVMASGAQQTQILQVGGTPILPVHYVVGLAPIRLGPTSHTVTVPSHQGNPLGWAGNPSGHAEVQRLGATPEDSRQYLSITGEMSQLSGRDRGFVGKASILHLAVDRVIVGYQQQPDTHRTAIFVLPWLGDKPLQSISHALARSGSIVGVFFPPQFTHLMRQDSLDPSTRYRIKPSVQNRHAIFEIGFDLGKPPRPLELQFCHAIVFGAGLFVLADRCSKLVRRLHLGDLCQLLLVDLPPL